MKQDSERIPGPSGTHLQRQVRCARVAGHVRDQPEEGAEEAGGGVLWARAGSVPEFREHQELPQTAPRHRVPQQEAGAAEHHEGEADRAAVLQGRGNRGLFASPYSFVGLLEVCSPTPSILVYFKSVFLLLSFFESKIIV